MEHNIHQPSRKVKCPYCIIEFPADPLPDPGVDPVCTLKLGYPDHFKVTLRRGTLTAIGKKNLAYALFKTIVVTVVLLVLFILLRGDARNLMENFPHSIFVYLILIFLPAVLIFAFLISSKQCLSVSRKQIKFLRYQHAFLGYVTIPSERVRNVYCLEGVVPFPGAGANTVHYNLFVLTFDCERFRIFRSFSARDLLYLELEIKKILGMTASKLP
jgi:hypothetical protein